MSDINYTTEGENERETGSGPAREVAGKRGPTPKFSVLLFHRVRQRVAGGEAVGRAIRASGIGASRFYECVAAQPRLAVDLQYAREHKLPAHRSTRAAGRSESDRRVKAWSAKDLQPGEVRHLSVRMLMLLLKLLAPRKYGMASPCGKDAEKRRPGDTASKVPPRSKAPPCTQSASGGEAVGERAEVRGQRSEETPESPCDFVAEDAGGKVVMARKCPEIGRDVGSRGGGVKAVEGSTLFTEFDGATAGAFLDLDLAHDLDRAEHPESGTKRHPVVCRRPVLKAVEGYRSPSPGGATEHLAANGHSWGIRRWAIEAGGEVVRRRETPESARDFVLEDVDDKGLTRKECPELPWGKAKGSGLNAKVRNHEDRTGSASGGEAVGERAEVRGQRSEETPESPCDFVAEDAGGKVVMARKCPEIGRDVGSRGGGVKAVEGSTLFTEFDGVTAGAFLDLDLAHDLDRAEHPESGTKCHPVVCRRPVLKAVEGYRSPSPGGAPERLAVNGHSWGIRRWAIEAGGGGRGNVED